MPFVPLEEPVNSKNSSLDSLISSVKSLEIDYLVSTIQEVKIASVKGPNHFWVLPKETPPDELKVRIEIESQMTSLFFQDTSWNYNEDVEYELKQHLKIGRIVAVKDDKQKTWKRAQVKDVNEIGFEKETIVDVFLIDEAKERRIADISNNIKLIKDRNWLLPVARAREVVLNGLAPVAKQFDFDGSERHGVRLPKWSDVSMILVNELLSSTSNVYVNFIKASSKNSSTRRLVKRYYGELIINMDLPLENVNYLTTKLSDKIRKIKKYMKECVDSSNFLSINKLFLRCRFCTYDEMADLEREKLERDLRISKIARKVTPFGNPILDPKKMTGSNSASTSKSSSKRCSSSKPVSPSSSIFVTYC